MSISRTEAQLTGRRAEQFAWRKLKAQGCKLLVKNYLCKMGELDLVVMDGEILAFVEVRYRRQELYGTSAETVTPSKQLKLTRAAQHYLLSNNYGDLYPCRFDVIAISGDFDHPSELNYNWIKNAFGF